MKTASIALAVAVLALSLGSAAFAQGRGDDRGQRHGQKQVHVQKQGHGNARGNSHRAPPQARYDRRPNRGDVRVGRGAGPEHNFYRGGRLPSHYRSRQYVVEDWRGHHLNAPPRGYHWVQAGSDYVLVAITTGVILSILLHN